MANTAVDERHLVWWHGCAEEADYQSFFLPPPSSRSAHTLTYRTERRTLHTIYHLYGFTGASSRKDGRREKKSGGRYKPRKGINNLELFTSAGKGSFWKRNARPSKAFIQKDKAKKEKLFCNPGNCRNTYEMDFKRRSLLATNLVHAALGKQLILNGDTKSSLFATQGKREERRLIVLS